MSHSKPLTTARMKQELRSWNGLNKFLRSVTEAQAQQLLDAERGNGARHLFLLRVYGRYSVLRAQREKSELLRLALKHKEEV